MEGSHSGLVRPLGERICRKASRVRISPPPNYGTLSVRTLDFSFIVGIF